MLCPGAALVIVLSSPIFCGTRRSSAACLLGSAGSRCARGDHPEAGRVSGRIVKVHSKNVDYKGYVHHASKDNPQYEIKSDKTDHIALHKGAALKPVRQ